MDYDTLLEKYKKKEVFIYGRSVMQIVDTYTYVDSGIKKTDFIFQTDRLNRGTITVKNNENTTDAALDPLFEKKLEPDLSQKN